jgi:hypothetical protein
MKFGEFSTLIVDCTPSDVMVIKYGVLNVSNKGLGMTDCLSWRISASVMNGNCFQVTCLSKRFYAFMKNFPNRITL